MNPKILGSGDLYLCTALFITLWGSAGVKRWTASLPRGDLRDPEILQNHSQRLQTLLASCSESSGWCICHSVHLRCRGWGDRVEAGFVRWLRAPKSLLSLRQIPASPVRVGLLWLSLISECHRLMFMVSPFSTAVPLTSLPFTSLNWLVTWLSFDMILFNSSFYIFGIDYFSPCHSIYPEMKTFLYSALLSTYSYTTYNGIKYFVCSFSKELIWHIAYSYLQVTHLRQDWVKSLLHQLSLSSPVLTISPSPVATDLQPTTLKSPPSFRKKQLSSILFFLKPATPSLSSFRCP